MQSQPLQRQEQLLQCLHMLSTAENDQQRLVSLTILPRLLDPANALDMRAAVESIPWRFIARLVKTRSSEDTGRLLLCKIGTGVWSGFCDQGISTSVFLDVIPQAAQILCELDATIELKMLVMKSLLTLMASEPGLERMRDESVLAIILDTLEKQPEQVQELMLHLLETLYDHYGLSLDLGQFITKIALVTKENHSALRFKFMRLAGDHHVALKAAVPHFRHVLKDLVRSKLIDEHREIVIVLCGVLFQCVGPKWLPIKNQGKMTDKSVTNEKLVAMIVHIACAEIRVILDDTGEEIVENYRLTNVLPLAYRILEGVISLLVIESEDNLEMDYAVLSSIRVALSETFIAVNSFLVERLDLFTLSPDLSIIDNSTTMISMRAYSKWMCEESDYEFDHVDRLIPLVIIYLSMDKFESIDITPIQFLTEILLMISYDAELVDSFVQKGGFKQLVRQFVSIYKTMATSTMISFCSILTNMFMVKTKILANIDSNFGNLLVPIADLITNEQDVTSMDAIANLSIVFVFLYRAPSGSDFIDTDLASMTVQKILQCASMPTVFENDRDLWYMALLALTDCISQTNLSSESKLKAAKQLSKVTDQQSLNAKDQQLIDRLMNVLV